MTTEVLDFTYDASGSPYTVTRIIGTSSSTYYYVVNAQGDVIRVVNVSGMTVAEYAYDPWGRVISATGTMAEVNPLRYRGYYYDAETEFYYLQSRYFDPVICRFINADVLLSSGSGAIGYNQFQYCECNPVNNQDTTGYAPTGTTLVHYSDISCAYGGGVAYSLNFSLGVSSKTRTLVAVTSTVTAGVGAIVSSLLSDVFAPSTSVVATKRISVAEKVHTIARNKVTRRYKHNTERHHIVAQADSRAAPARAILKEVGIGIHSSINIVTLSTAMHKYLHTAQYYSFVNTVIMSTYFMAGEDPNAQEAAVENALDYLADALKVIDKAMSFPQFGA